MTSSISYVMCMLWSEIWTVGSFAFFLRLGHLFFQKVSSPCFDLRLNTLDVSKGWIQPSSPFQTSTLFTSPSLPQSPPPPSPSPRLLPYPITHNPSMIFPLYLFRVSPIPVECRRYSWDNRGLTGWLASAGNREYSSFLQREAAPIRFSLHLSLAFFIREMKVPVNKWMDRGRTGAVILASIILSLLPSQLLSGLRTRMRYHHPLGNQFVLFFVASQRDEEWSLFQSTVTLFTCF